MLKNQRLMILSNKTLKINPIKIAKGIKKYMYNKPNKKVRTNPINFSVLLDLINSKYFSGVPELGLFKQDGVTYWVLACPPWYGY